MSHSWQWYFVIVACLLRDPGLVAQEQESKNPDKVVVSLNSSEFRRHEPNTWSVLSLIAKNSTDEAGEGLVSAYFTPEVSQQFARRVWVPAHARRTGWLPFRMPQNVPRNEERRSITTLSLDASSGREVLKRRSGELLTSDILLTVDHELGRTLTYFRKPLPNEANIILDVDADASDTVVLSKLCADLSRTVLDIEANFLPPWSEVLHGFDQFVLTSDRIVNDCAGISALRSWVRDGGRLWIMLDRVSPSTVSAILGNGENLEIIDRVELDQYVIETTDRIRPDVVQDKCDYEVPVDLVRVVTSATDVPSRVNGWPAAIWMPYGEGEILVTALAPRGWRAEKGEIPMEALKLLATRFYSGRDGRPDVTGFRPALQEQIGYRIPKRSFAASVLGAYCLALVGAGVVLVRRGRLDWLAWIVPALTLIVTALLFTVGATNANSVKPIIAYGQLLRVSPQTNEVQVNGLAAIYDQQSREISLQGQQRIWLLPASVNDSEARRVVWTDRDATETQNATTLAGSVGLASMTGTGMLASRVAATGSLGPVGLVGKIDFGSLQGTTDFVIAGPPVPALAPTVAADGSFEARPDQVLAADQFSSDNLLSDEQRRRQDVLRHLLNPNDTNIYPHQTSFFFWCHPIDSNLKFPGGFAINGSALIAIPLQLERTPPKTPFQIPATFLRAEVSSGKQGVSTVYDPRTGQWVKGLTSSTEVYLRFQMPQQVIPCELTRALLTVRLNAPSREVRISLQSGPETETTRTFRNPSGVLEVEFAESPLFLDERVSVRVGIAVGETDMQRSKRETAQAMLQNPKPDPNKTLDLEATFDNSMWQIDYVRLSVTGETL